MSRHFFVLLAVLLTVAGKAGAQEFFNLTAEEVRIDSVLPVFTYEFDLGYDDAAEDYEVSIDYPEFIDMSPTDVLRYRRITTDTLPPLPEVHQYVGISRRRASLSVWMVPLVMRDGKLQKLVSFKLSLNRRPAAKRAARAASAADRYAAQSVLAEGTWVKISVPETGIYELSDAFIRKCGFSNPSRVRLFGYGGALQPERVTGDYLVGTDDLKEVPTCNVGGRRLFRGVGPVSWSSNNTLTRTRNPYSTIGCYFLTEGDSILTVDSTAFAQSFYPSNDDYHSLCEPEEYAWFHGGRNLYEQQAFTIGTPRSYKLSAPGGSGRLNVVMSFNSGFKANVAVNGTQVGVLSTDNYPDENSVAMVQNWTFEVDDLQKENTVTITQTSGGTVRLDYLSLTFATAQPMPSLTLDDFATPSMVETVANQNHHADGPVDMVILIPKSGKLLAQAQRLQQLHEQKDSLRVRIVNAGELFNEFSSGTPDANAYRRYLKMLYDRAASEADMPRYLLLMGDGAWDNRMLSPDWKSTSPDDFLLCFESENSFSETYCYVTDDFFCMLDDGEGGNLTQSDKADVAVGRLSARNADEAQTLVDKIYSYHANEQAGAWQNTLCFMADDGNQNLHMGDAEKVVTAVEKLYDGFDIKKIYWDAYTRKSSSTGFSFPDVTQLIKKQMQAGALVMNYSGHGAAYCLSHEQVVKLADFALPTSLRLPLWVTASCDIMPFDGQDENIGETAMLNKKGGAIAFFGTTRTVYSDRNMKINRAFMRNVLGSVDGQRNSIGEAVRLTKNGLITATTGDESDRTQNKLQYTLLGDPALVLAAPTGQACIDSVGGYAAAEGIRHLVAGEKTRVSGYVKDRPAYNGVVTITVQDVEETVRCKRNNLEEADTAFIFRDRPNTLYLGQDSVRNGRFSVEFAVPLDISGSDDEGQLLVYTIDEGKTVSTHGVYDNFVLVGKDDTSSDGVGPSIYCYLNSEHFNNGDVVNHTPFFYAELSDKDGINAAGSGIGHNLELVVDGDMMRTYDLSDHFVYDFGDYRSGSVGYSLPELSAGQHRLLFRAWDVLNNSSTAELAFYVDPQQQPALASVVCTRNPARTSTSFLITHDRAGSELDVTLEIFDTSGRKLWEKTESGTAADRTYTVEWDLTTGSGSRLRTGVYLYRVLVSSNGSSEASAAQKLIILREN